MPRLVLALALWPDASEAAWPAFPRRALPLSTIVADEGLETYVGFADLDRDGLGDLVTTGGWVLWGDGGPPGRRVSEDLGLGDLTALGDVNGDGWTDLVGPRAWWEAPAYVPHDAPDGLADALADVDGDGDPDFVRWGDGWIDNAPTVDHLGGFHEVLGLAALLDADADGVDGDGDRDILGLDTEVHYLENGLRP